MHHLGNLQNTIIRLKYSFFFGNVTFEFYRPLAATPTFCKRLIISVIVPPSWSTTCRMLQLVKTVVSAAT